MTLTTTPRLGLTRWSAGTDQQRRTQFDASHAALETLAAIAIQGTRAARPAPGTTQRLYAVTGDGTADNNGLMFYDNGTAWSVVGSALRLAKAVADAAVDVPLTIKGAAGQSGDLQQYTSSAGSVLSSVNAAGQPMALAGGHIGPGAKIAGAALDVSPLTTGAIALVLKLLGSQTGDAFQLQNSSGTVLSKWSAAGILSSLVGFVAGSQGTASVAAKLQLNAGQTADVLQVLDPDGSTVRSSITANGGLFAKVGAGVALKAQGTAGQQVQQWLSSAAAELMALSAAGVLSLANTAPSALVVAGGVSVGGDQALAGKLGAGGLSPTAPGRGAISARALSTSEPAMLAMGSAGQTEDPLKVVDVSGTFLAGVGSDGAVRSPNLTAATAGHTTRDAPPFVEARASGVIPNLGTGTNTKILFPTLVEQSESGMHDGSQSYLILPAVGLWELEAVVNWDGNATGYRSLKIQVANPEVGTFTDFAELCVKGAALTGSNRNSQILIGKGRVDFPGFWYRVMGLQDSGSPIAYMNDHSTRFSARWLQP